MVRLPLLVLAGGLGTRLRAVVNDRPKPLADIAGKPFLEHLLNFWVNAGIREFVLAVGYKGHQIEDFFGASYKGATIKYSRDEELLGTGGAIKKAIIDGLLLRDFIAVNGDSFVNIEAVRFIDLCKKADKDLIITVKPAKDSIKRYGQFLLDNRFAMAPESLANIYREGMLDATFQGASVINCGVYYMSQNFAELVRKVPSQKFSLEESFFSQLHYEYTLAGYFSQADFIDIGVPCDFSRASSFLMELKK